MLNPLVSIIIPVYNGMPFLREAMDSIINQDYSPWECLVINDGSSDKSLQTLRAYAKKDARIRLITHTTNLGIVASLNEGLTLARGKYLCRMDADDYALPTRLSTQVKFMESHKTVGVCGTWIKVVGEKNYIWKPPKDSPAIKTQLFLESVIAHPTACIRSATLKQYHLHYDPKYEYVEDYKLWIDISRISKLANIPKVLLHYRSHPAQTSATRSSIQNTHLAHLKRSLLLELLPQATSKQVELHNLAMSYHEVKSWGELRKFRQWYLKLITANAVRKIYPTIVFNQLIAERWSAICYLAKNLNAKRYLYIFSVPRFILPAIRYIFWTRAVSLSKYLIATIKRFL